MKSVQIRSFFWSAFSRIWTEYGELRSISLYSVRMRENTDRKNLRIWTLFTQCLRKRMSMKGSADELIINGLKKICGEFCWRKSFFNLETDLFSNALMGLLSKCLSIKESNPSNYFIDYQHIVVNRDDYPHTF